MASVTGTLHRTFFNIRDYKFKSKNLIVRFGEPFKVGECESLEDANKKLEIVIGDLYKIKFESANSRLSVNF